MKENIDIIEDHWRKYLPLKYANKFPLKQKREILSTVKSRRHQTEKYIVETFYKPISRT